MSARQPGKQAGMLRKLLWSGLYAGLSAAMAIGARTAVSRVWKLATGNEPPARSKK